MSNEQFNKNLPFPEVAKPPTKMVLKLQERIKYMFGITVDPVIIRKKESYHKTNQFRHLWSMRTKNGQYEISSYEKAGDMAKKAYWQVLDQDLFNKPNSLIITKFIY